MERLSADAKASWSVNSPCLNSVATSGSASMIRPMVAGALISSTQRSAQSKVAENRSGVAAACSLDSRGRITVPSATPKMPIGNSTSRSE
jgi:hypothetical protein